MRSRLSMALTLALLMSLHFSLATVRSVPSPSSRLDGMYSTWVSEWVDEPKLFLAMDDRALALDGNDLPHVAYGGDHLYYAVHDGTTWHRQTVDSTYGVGSYASLALDAAGRPHISYIGNGALRYAYFDGATWHITVVDRELGQWGRYTSLALNSANHPHICYCVGAPNCALRYAHYDGASWHIEVIDEQGAIDPALALDSDDQPHISYGRSTTLKYAHRGAIGSASDRTIAIPFLSHGLTYAYTATWQIDTVDNNGASYTSLVLDAAGHPHIGYGAHSQVRYAHYDGAQWQIQVASTEEGQYISLALGSTGYPHISYNHTNTYSFGGLRYAYYDGASWQVETLESGPYRSPGHTSLALDAQNKPHIIYLNWPEIDVEYFRRDGSGWEMEIVDDGNSVGGHPSLVLDSGDQPHISYSNDTTDDLYYAYHAGGSWHKDLVVSNGGLASLALDRDDLPHISYCHISTGPFPGGCVGVNYAHYDGTTWYTETVDSTGENSFIAVDAAGQPHIAYYSPAHREIRYAAYNSTGWQTETVANAGYMEYFHASLSLALDTADYPHISFYDWNDQVLRYAHYDGSAWHIELVDEAAPNGNYLALDANGVPHVVYPGAGTVQYAYRATPTDQLGSSAVWHIEAVGDRGIIPVLALDSAGRPHVSYMSSSLYYLRYAYYDGATWHIETVEAGGGSPSLAIGREDRPHISYGDACGDLKYASRHEWPYSLYLPVIMLADPSQRAGK